MSSGPRASHGGHTARWKPHRSISGKSQSSLGLLRLNNEAYPFRSIDTPTGTFTSSPRLNAPGHPLELRASFSLSSFSTPLPKSFHALDQQQQQQSDSPTVTTERSSNSGGRLPECKRVASTGSAPRDNWNILMTTPRTHRKEQRKEEAFDLHVERKRSVEPLLTVRARQAEESHSARAIMRARNLLIAERARLRKEMREAEKKRKAKAEIAVIKTVGLPESVPVSTPALHRAKPVDPTLSRTLDSGCTSPIRAKKQGRTRKLNGRDASLSSTAWASPRGLDDKHEDDEFSDPDSPTSPRNYPLPYFSPTPEWLGEREDYKRVATDTERLNLVALSKDPSLRTRGEINFLVKRLQTFKVLRNLPVSTLRDIATNANHVEFKKNARIYEAGDVAEHAYLILRGSVRVSWEEDNDDTGTLGDNATVGAQKKKGGAAGTREDAGGIDGSQRNGRSSPVLDNAKDKTVPRKKFVAECKRTGSANTEEKDVNAEKSAKSEKQMKKAGRKKKSRREAEKDEGLNPMEKNSKETGEKEMGEKAASASAVWRRSSILRDGRGFGFPKAAKNNDGRNPILEQLEKIEDNDLDLTAHPAAHAKPVGRRVEIRDESALAADHCSVMIVSYSVLYKARKERKQKTAVRALESLKRSADFDTCRRDRLRLLARLFRPLHTSEKPLLPGESLPISGPEKGPLYLLVKGSVELRKTYHTFRFIKLSWDLQEKKTPCIHKFERVMAPALLCAEHVFGATSDFTVRAASDDKEGATILMLHYDLAIKAFEPGFYKRVYARVQSKRRRCTEEIKEKTIELRRDEVAALPRWKPFKPPLSKSQMKAKNLIALPGDVVMISVQFTPIKEHGERWDM
uniref:Cyclic nucleotide-binding domain-containing protein n=1 Tax=Lotharella globosa TaxID=91324 RepID=A0A7S3YRG6_9EUKA